MTTLQRSWMSDIDRLSEAVNSIQKCLECAICLQLMTAPVRTRCDHSFCQKCIGRVLRKNAPCPLCKEVLNRRSIFKDDHLESCIHKFQKLVDAIQTDSHIDIQSHLKQPRDTRESCSNSGSSQSKVSRKRKTTRRQSIRSDHSASKTDRPSSSRRTDCDNSRYDTDSLIRQSDSTSSTPTVLPIDEDDVRYDTSEAKVRTWIHSFIEESDINIEGNAEDETRPNKENMSRANKGAKKRRQSGNDVKNNDPNASNLKYNAIHAKTRSKDRKRSASAGKSNVEDRVDIHREDSSSSALATASAPAIVDRPPSVDTWTRVMEVGKEMRGKKKKMKKLSVSTEKSIEKSSEKSIDKDSEKSVDKDSEKSVDKSMESIEKRLKRNKKIPRIIEDVMLSPSSKYESLNKSATYDDTINNEMNVSNQQRESTGWQQDVTDNKPDLSVVKITQRASVSERPARNREKSFANDKTNSSMLETSYHSETSFITLAEGEQTRIKNLNNRQMNEIIGFEADSDGLTGNDANVSKRKHQLKQKKDEEQEEDTRIMMEPYVDSPSSHQQRLIILTPEKLNESVLKNRVSDSRTSVSKLMSPTCLPTTERTTAATTPRETEVAVTSQSRSWTPNKLSRLSLKRYSKNIESPLSSNIPLSVNDSSSKAPKSVDSSMSKNSQTFERLEIVKRDLSSQIDKDFPQTGQAIEDVPVTAGTSSKNTIVIKKDNNGHVGGTVHQGESRLTLDSTRSRKSRDINRTRKNQEYGFPIKFTQLGTLVRRRDIKYYYRGVLKHEQRLPGKIRVSTAYNMQQSISKSEMTKPPHNFTSSPASSNDSQNSTGGVMLEDVRYMDKSVSNTNTVLEVTRLSRGVSASSTPKRHASCTVDRTVDQGNSPSASKPPVAEEAVRSPRTPRADRSATKNVTSNSIKLLSPDKDSQLKFLTIDSPMSQHGQSELATSTRVLPPVESEFEKKKGPATIKNSKNLAETKDSQWLTDEFGPSSGSSEFQPTANTKKRSRRISEDEKLEGKSDVDDVEDDSSDSVASINSLCTVKLSNKKTCKSQEKTSSIDKRRRLSSSRNRVDDMVLEPDNPTRQAHERKFRRIVSISDSDSELESWTCVATKSHRNTSGDRYDQRNASIVSTPTRRSAREASDEDLRIRSIVDKWNSEHSAGQKRPAEGTRVAQGTSKRTRLTSEETTTSHCRSLSTNSSEGQRRAKSSKSTVTSESDPFFESNSVFNSQGLHQLACHMNDKSSKSRKSQSSMDPFNDDIINRVLEIDRSPKSNHGARRSTGVASRNNNDDDDGDDDDEGASSQRGKNEPGSNLLQDNFDEIIANVELPQSEDMIACSELPARRNSDRNLNRMLTEQNMSSCPAMTNESRDAVARHGQMIAASSTADIFECSGYTAGKNVKRTHSSKTSANSDKENTHCQRKHADHAAEEERKDKKNVSAKSPDAVDNKTALKKSASQEKCSFFERAAVTERTPRKEREINVPAAPASRHRASDSEMSAKDLSSSEYDTLMNITLQQARLRMIEEDLFGGAPGRVGTKTERTSARNDPLREEQRTPKKRKRNATSGEHSADEDDIVENTPETKMRNTPKVTSSSITVPAVTTTTTTTTDSCRKAGASTTAGKGRQLNKQQRATTSGAASSLTKRTADGNTTKVDNTTARPGKNAHRRSDLGRLRFVCSGLTTTQIASVQKFARLHDADYARQFDPDVTHVIVNTSGAENMAKSTLKYLQGIAHRKWVVSYKWIEDCATAGRKLLPEAPYEATTQSADVNGPGPRNSRLSDKGLFQDFTFLCVGPYDNVSLSQYQDLLRATGATVVDSMETLAVQKKGLRGVVIQGDTQDDNTIEYWYENARAAPILIDWVVECIGHYKLFPLIPYIQTLSPQHYCAIGYPREIVGDDEYSDMSG
ncbi:breast cancer type 1 susceptibility protein homolog isoform X2 [Harpegnathos saltator]|uniref:breast cancer type 1 susceptibility protein homolog isoform X2 n=1 Tax=Harpegnathos saltator TaxID=610380 RepID=UPI0005903C70|nr:breast cancer type 1 susceptibility protein homolog isoform X2 [Harpegnathos saltator]